MATTYIGTHTPAGTLLRTLQRRRTLLAALTATAADCALARAAGAAGSDPHTIWWTTCQRLRAAAEAMDDDHTDVAFSRVGDLESLVALTPARNPSGIRAQVQLVLHHLALGEISDATVIGLRQAERALDTMRCI